MIEVTWSAHFEDSRFQIVAMAADLAQILICKRFLTLSSIQHSSRAT